MPNQLIIEIPQWVDVDTTEMERVVRMMLADNGRELYNLTIVAVDDDLMADLNQRFRGVSGTTDVLSFVIEDEPLEGEVFLSVEQAQTAAAIDKAALKAEIYRQAVHGILHLLGFHHDSLEEERLNREMMERYLAEF
ncbi:MAG: rRNA maturation RNase YbeY [candidate division Zixibacteria bacterium]|nr:rRNA maturation RNase YbeY [Candidatus Tariuqbacter arcticus]